MSAQRILPIYGSGGQINTKVIESANLRKIREWIQAVLLGEFPIMGEDRDEPPHIFLKGIYHSLSPSTRGVFEDVLLSFLADFTQNVDSIWRTEVGDELLLLIPDVFLTSNRPKDPIDLLLYYIERSGAIYDKEKHHWRSLQTLVGLKYKTQLQFWIKIYETCGNEYLGLIFAGMTLANVNDAFEWIGKETHQTSAVKALTVRLPWLVREYGVEKIQGCLVDIISLFPKLQRDNVVSVAQKLGISVFPNTLSNLPLEDLTRLARELQITIPESVNSLVDMILFLEEKLRDDSKEYRKYKAPFPDIEVISCISEYVNKNPLQLSQHFRSYFCDLGKVIIETKNLGDDAAQLSLELMIIETKGVDVSQEIFNLRSE